MAETMNSGGYTYARLTADGKDTWIAGSEFPVKVGDQLTAAVDMPMENFRSRTLNRDFPLVYFVREVALNGQALTATAAGGSMPALAGSHGGDAATVAEPDAPPLIAAVPPVPGSVKIADVWAKRTALSGKPLALRGRIVKVNLAIMGTNWYHLQDGSGVVKDGTHDLVVTSAAELKAGDVVTVNGTLTTDKDFGAGYSYEAIVENARITP
ncbi:MAG: DNA-binding protein [Acidobacteria bacterium]|nr:DNA-binding protein [Acidobacteriota bacterium]